MSRKVVGFILAALVLGPVIGQDSRPRRARAERGGSAPRVETLAPDFELKTEKGGETVRLSSFREKKPVALIFGSYT